MARISSGYISSDSICQKFPKASFEQDLISNLPSIATEKILKHLPLEMAARMSVLSTKWNENWLSLRHLVFGKVFWEREGNNTNNIVSNILFHHDGPLQKFHLYIPEDGGSCIHISQWLSFLSKTCVKKIALINSERVIPIIPSRIFKCKELVKLRLESFVLNPPPRDFKGFANLWSLKLVDVECNPDILGSLIASCPRLTILRIEGCVGLDHIVIDVPSLESLVIKGVFHYLCFKNIASLTNISLFLDKTENPNKVKLDHLNKVKFTGISGTRAELEIIEYLLAISGALEYFFFKCENLDAVSELKVSRELMRIQRASTKAQLVCLE